MDRSFSNRRVSSSCLLLLYVIEIPAFNANSVDPDQMPRSAESIQCIHCLQMPPLWHKWVNSDTPLNYRGVVGPRVKGPLT